MSIKAYRKLSVDKIEEKIIALKAELAQVRMDLKTGRDKDYSQIAKKKTEIARLMTVMSDKLFLDSTKEIQEAQVVEDAQKVDDKVEEKAKTKKTVKKTTKLKADNKDGKEE